MTFLAITWWKGNTWRSGKRASSTKRRARISDENLQVRAFLVVQRWMFNTRMETNDGNPSRLWTMPNGTISVFIWAIQRVGRIVPLGANRMPGIERTPKGGIWRKFLTKLSSTDHCSRRQVRHIWSQLCSPVVKGNNWTKAYCNSIFADWRISDKERHDKILLSALSENEIRNYTILMPISPKSKKSNSLVRGSLYTAF